MAQCGQGLLVRLGRAVLISGQGPGDPQGQSAPAKTPKGGCVRMNEEEAAWLTHTVAQGEG